MIDPVHLQSTIPAMFCQRAEISGARPALHFRRQGKPMALAWTQVLAEAARTGAALAQLGVAPGDRVAQASPNRYEWVLADLGIQLAGAVHVPLHNSLSGEQMAYQIVHSGAKAVLIASAEQAAKLDAVASSLPSDAPYVSYDPVATTIGGRPIGRLGHLLRSIGQQAGRDLAERTRQSLKPSDLATIIYTSGTTGEPKGVMLSQGNLASNAIAALEAFGCASDDLRLNWLPLSHIFARTCDLYTWISGGTQLALADSPETVLDHCREWRPTLMNAVPYFWEKLVRKLHDEGRADAPGALAELLGGRMRACVSGGAALPDPVARYYERQGVPLVQGYGLTESSPVISMNTVAAHKLGTVGRAAPGVEMKIAADGEILSRGPHIMQGYWQNPQATAETIRDGWLHTGDLGSIDDEGYLKISGRKKELIVTSAGKNIAPAYLEGLLVSDPLIEQAVVIGEGRSYLVALIVPNKSAVAAMPADQNCAGNFEAWRQSPAARALVQEHVTAALANVSHHEQVRRVALLPHPFSVDKGEMTPSLKLRRAVIQQNYAAEIEAMYGK